jgi:dipeptidyl aminopeptidase/acylaminoacyl peptidase
VGVVSDRELRVERYLGFLRAAARADEELVLPRWLEDGSSLCLRRGSPADRSFVRVDSQTGSVDPLFDIARLRATLLDALGHEPPHSGVPFSEFSFEGGERVVRFSVDGRSFRLDLTSYELLAAAKETAGRGDASPRLLRTSVFGGAPPLREVPSPDGSCLAGLQDHNIYLRFAADGRMEFITSDGVPGHEWDLQGTDFVSAAPARWSPDGLWLATTKCDSRMVLRTPILHWLKQTEEVEWTPYTRVGGPMVQTEMYIVDVLAHRPVRIGGDQRDQVIGLLGWNSRGEFMFLRATRDLKTRSLEAADPATGEHRTVFTETSNGVFNYSSWPTYCELLPSGDGAIVCSDRDGWSHLYRYDLDGRCTQLTSGEFPVLTLAGVDEQEGWVYLTAHGEARIHDTHLYRVGLDGGNFTRLTEHDGHHTVQLSPSKRSFIDTHSSFTRPPRVELRTTEGAHVHTVSEAEVSTLTEAGWTPPEEFVALAADGETELHGVIYKPPDFDPAKRYPVIDSLYGGPQAKTVQPTFVDLGPRGVGQALAQLGCITITVDARGTPERSARFQDVVYHNFGRNEIPDHVAVLNELARDRPYMDMTRVGITGGSWGGYMTIRGMVLAPDLFTVGVAVYPVADLDDHWAAPIEPVMGLHHTNADGYEYASSIRLAASLNGKLLLIHGTSDLNAPFSSTMKLVDALFRANKHYDLIVMPEENHALTPAAQTYVNNARGSYFLTHLVTDPV